MKPTNRRRYFTEAELGKLISAARKSRCDQRNATLILLIARHGLRVSEAVDLEWDQIDFTRAHLHVRRLKGGIASLPYGHPHMLRHTCGHLLADAGHDTRRLQLWLATRTSSTQPTTPSLAQSRLKIFGSPNQWRINDQRRKEGDASPRCGSRAQGDIFSCEIMEPETLGADLVLHYVLRSKLRKLGSQRILSCLWKLEKAAKIYCQSGGLAQSGNKEKTFAPNPDHDKGDLFMAERA